MMSSAPAPVEDGSRADKHFSGEFFAQDGYRLCGFLCRDGACGVKGYLGEPYPAFIKCPAECLRVFCAEVTDYGDDFFLFDFCGDFVFHDILLY